MSGCTWGMLQASVFEAMYKIYRRGANLLPKQRNLPLTEGKQRRRIARMVRRERRRDTGARRSHAARRVRDGRRMRASRCVTASAMSSTTEVKV